MTLLAIGITLYKKDFKKENKNQKTKNTPTSNHFLTKKYSHILIVEEKTLFKSKTLKQFFLLILNKIIQN